jgi:tetratricopeptide (TPR) repeat protein
MKPNFALKPILKPIFVSTLLCGALLSSALADDTPVAQTTVPAAQIPAVASSTLPEKEHKFFFEEADTPAPNGKLDVYVRLSDSFDPKFAVRVLNILEDAGQYTRAERAKIVADRLQQALISDSNFVDKILPPVSLRGEVVLKLKNQEADPDGFIITADKGSMRAVNAASTFAYANMIANVIKDRLAGIKLRDAKFDYDLKTPKEINDRAVEYFSEAKSAYAEDKDTEVAISKCEIALKLEPGFNNCRLCLADLYSETKQYKKARDCYQNIADASDADQKDRDVAHAELSKLSNIGG